MALSVLAVVNERSTVCSPLSVVQIVIDLRHVNNCLWKQIFKYEDIRVALRLMRPGDYVVRFDLKSGYHHVDVHL